VGTEQGKHMLACRGDRHGGRSRFQRSMGLEPQPRGLRCLFGEVEGVCCDQKCLAL